MQSINEIRTKWVIELSKLYPEREVINLFNYTLEDIFGYSRTSILSSGNLELSVDASLQLNRVLDRLITGEPYQYIVGFTYFDELKLLVTPAVLIPRPETEELAHWIISDLGSDFNGHIVDWCTGSGCIALTLKFHLPKSFIIGYDVSTDALIVATRNAFEYNLQVDFAENNALSPKEINAEVDVIVSNPPYIPLEEQAEMRLNVVKFEPELALFVPNEDPLLFYRSLAIDSKKRLKQGGALYFELHEDFAQETKQMLEEFGFGSIEIRRDLQGKQRMLKCIKE